MLKRNINEMQEQLQRAIDEKTRLAAQLEGQRLEQIMQGGPGGGGGGAAGGEGGGAAGLATLVAVQAPTRARAGAASAPPSPAHSWHTQVLTVRLRPLPTPSPPLAGMSVRATGRIGALAQGATGSAARPTGAGAGTFSR